MNPLFCAISASLLMLASLTLPGCDGSFTTSSKTTRDSRNSKPQHSFGKRKNQSALRLVSGAELESLIRHSKLPVLVEFGVDFGCVRCDQMKTEMAHLAQQYEGQATVVRVDFNANRQTAVRYGATICPSYVVFDRSHAVRTRSFPTSADLLSTDLESVMKKEDKQF